MPVTSNRSIVDIIFRSGEFYNNSDLISTAVNAAASLFGALISGGIAIWIFVKGNKYARKREREKEFERLQEVKIYFETLVSQLIGKPIDQQLKEILRFTSKLKQHRFQHTELRHPVTLSADHIKQIDHRDLFTIYVSGRDIQLHTILLQELLAELDIIASMEQTLKSYANSYFEDFKRFESDFQTQSDGIQKLFREELSKAQSENITRKEDPFLGAMLIHFQTWMALQDNPSIEYRDPYVVNDSLLTPLLHLCDKYQGDPRTPTLGSFIVNAKFALENFDELRRFYRRAFLLSARQLVRSRIGIQEYLTKLQVGNMYGVRLR